MEFLRQQFRELEDAELRAGEEDELEREHRVSAHAERLRDLVGEATVDLTDEDDGAAARLGRAERRLREAARHDPALEALTRDLEAARLTAEETGREVAHYLDGLESDPARLEALEGRLALLARLRRKYARDEAGLVELREELRERVGEAGDPAARLEELEAEVRQAESALEDAASALSDARSRAAARLGRDTTRELRGLGMADARFTVRLDAPGQGLTVPGREHPLGSRGAETAVFVLAANPGEPGGPVDEVASGGEASRVMLALKTVLRRSDPVGLTVFDEIDAGIGGLVADQVGKRLAALARERQVLVVTHLPVIAGRADAHVALRKRSRGGRTAVTAETLGAEARERELARMMAGEGANEEARRTARTLLRGDG
jgi:DNA repair protein RecN (Recombination protein N)